jgi:hypothetical protein
MARWGQKRGMGPWIAVLAVVILGVVAFWGGAKTVSIRSRAAVVAIIGFSMCGQFQGDIRIYGDGHMRGESVGAANADEIGALVERLGGNAQLIDLPCPVQQPQPGV